MKAEHEEDEAKLAVVKAENETINMVFGQIKIRIKFKILLLVYSGTYLTKQNFTLIKNHSIIPTFLFLCSTC